MSMMHRLRLVENWGYVKAAEERQKAETSTRTNSTAFARSAHGPATEQLWTAEDEASFPEMQQNVTPQLLDFFRVRGCGATLAKALAQKLSDEVLVAVREVLSRPGIQAAPKLGVITVGNLKLDLERRLFWRDDEPIHLSPEEFDL